MIFEPTGTTQAMIKACLSVITGGDILDLGCGSGVIGAEMRRFGKVYASDISLEAITEVKNKYPDIDARVSDIFSAWQGHKFDYIIDDVSGIGEGIGKIHWFKGVPCDSGKDGADLVCRVLEEAPNYLKDGGSIIFPIVSLSNVKRTLDAAKKYKLTKLSHTIFPLPYDIHKSLLDDVEGCLYQNKFGRILFFTDIYRGEI